MIKPDTTLPMSSVHGGFPRAAAQPAADDCGDDCRWSRPVRRIIHLLAAVVPWLTLALLETAVSRFAR